MMAACLCAVLCVDCLAVKEAGSMALSLEYQAPKPEPHNLPLLHGSSDSLFMTTGLAKKV